MQSFFRFLYRLNMWCYIMARMVGPRKIVLVLAMLALLVSSAWSQTPDGNETENKTISWKIKTTYVQKYINNGIDLQNGTPSIQPELTLDLIGAGVYFSGWGNLALDDDFREWDEADFFIGKYFSLLSDKRYQTDFDLFYSYIYFFRQPRIEDTHKFALSLKMPQLLRLWGNLCLAPAFSGYYEWGWDDEKTGSLAPGIELTLPLPTPWIEEKKPEIHWLVEVWYDNGDPELEVPSGWGYTAMELSADFPWRGVSLRPAFHYQYVFNPTPSRENDAWFTVSVAYQR